MSDSKLNDLLKTMGTKLLGEDDDGLLLTEPKRIVSGGSSSASEGSVVVHHKKFDQKLQDIEDGEELEENDEDEDEDNSEQPLRIKTKNLGVEDEDEEDDFNDYVIDPPLPPPRELHPGKLYALYEFSGNDPSHCELERDDAVFLLNDQDSYWWLVKKEYDGRIGFAPAECLETYHERLARLNCWKNEELERNSKDSFETFPENRPRSNSRLSKSVAFSNDMIIPDEIDDEREEDDEIISGNEHEYGEEEEEEDDDETSNYDDDEFDEQEPTDQDEVLTESDNFPVTPLMIAKKNKPNPFQPPQPSRQSQRSYERESDFDDDSPLVAPTAFFNMNNSTSGSIGTYSPSSSEFDSPGHTPPLTQFRKPIKEQNEIEDFEKKGNIPQSKGTTDMFNSIRMLDEIINDEIDTSRSSSGEEEGDRTITYDDECDDKLSSPITLDEEKKNLSNITNSTFTNSNISLHLTSSTTSVDNESVTKMSNDSISTPKIQQRQINLQVSQTTDVHPEIESIFKGTMSKMDELEEKLRLLNERFS